MAQNSKAKTFEQKFKNQWIETVPYSFCYRLYDTQGGYLGISNVGDFICYKYPQLYVIDCKTKKGNTIPFSDIRQYDKMLEYKNIKGVNIGIIVWFYEHDKVVWVPIQTLEKLKNEDKKSFNIKMLGDNNYESLEIPSKKLRTFMNSDYGELVRYYNGESSN